MKVLYSLYMLAFCGFGDAQIVFTIADTYGVLTKGAGISNTGETRVAGNIAAIGQAITGFDAPGVTGGTMGEATGTQSNPTVDNEAFAQAQAAYTAASKDGSTRDLTGTDLGGLVLVAGVYTFDSSAQLTGTLTLNGLATDVFIFQIGSTLTTASGSAVVLTGGAQACNVYFQVGSSATLGTATNFNGNILAQASITLTTGASTNGGLYALTGAVTLDTNIINAQVCSASTTSTTATATATSTATSTSTSPSTSSTTATTATSVSTTITTTASTTPATTSASSTTVIATTTLPNGAVVTTAVVTPVASVTATPAAPVVVGSPATPGQAAALGIAPGTPLTAAQIAALSNLPAAAESVPVVGAPANAQQAAALGIAPGTPLNAQNIAGLTNLPVTSASVPAVGTAATPMQAKSLGIAAGSPLTAANIAALTGKSSLIPAAGSAATLGQAAALGITEGVLLTAAEIAALLNIALTAGVFPKLMPQDNITFGTNAPLAVIPTNLGAQSAVWVTEFLTLTTTTCNTITTVYIDEACTCEKSAFATITDTITYVSACSSLVPVAITTNTSSCDTDAVTVPVATTTSTSSCDTDAVTVTVGSQLPTSTSFSTEYVVSSSPVTRVATATAAVVPAKFTGAGAPRPMAESGNAMMVYLLTLAMLLLRL